VTGPPSGSLPLATWDISAGNYPTETIDNDTRPWLQIASRVGVPSVFYHGFGYTTSGGGAQISGDFYTTAPAVNGVRNGVGLTMDNTAGSEVVIHHLLGCPTAAAPPCPLWDGSAVNIILQWSQGNGAPGGTSVRWDVSTQCTHPGSSTTTSFGTVGSTLVLVPAVNTWAYSTIAVPMTGCIPGDKVDIKVVNSPTGTGTTYVGGNFQIFSMSVIATQ